MTELKNGLRLCRLEDLADPGARGFALRTARGVIDIFLVRRAGTIFAFENHCPHTGSPLDWMPDQFLNLDRTLIQCATHAALFRIDDGFCVSGPCAGQALTPFAVTLADGWVLVEAEQML